MLKKLIALATVVFFLMTTVTLAPDGTVELVAPAEAQTAGNADDVDPALALLLSLVIPGILQLAWLEDPTLGLTYFLVALVGYIAIGIVLQAVFSPVGGALYDLAWLIALLFYFGVGYYAYSQARSNMYAGASDGSKSTPPRIAAEAVILYEGEPVPAY